VLLAVVGLVPGELYNVDRMTSTYTVSVEPFSSIINAASKSPGLMVIVCAMLPPDMVLVE
jgi:hypothetical protein